MSGDFREESACLFYFHCNDPDRIVGIWHPVSGVWKSKPELH